MPCKHLRRFRKLLAFSAVLFSLGNRTFAQEAKPEPRASSGGTYKSAIDETLTIERVSVLPFTDNLQGIYARPLETHFISLVDQMHRWNYISASTSGPILTPEELESSPEKTLQISQGLNADAFFSGRITKGPNGITVHVSLFLSKDGKLLSQAILKDYKQFNLADIKEQTQRLLSEIAARLPYSGRVLSRDANRVTVNLGGKDGLQPGQVLSVIQIIQAKRHPKFNFLVSTEKEILGKIKVLKVDETLSFGQVVTEKEKGAIQKNSKIGPIDFVVYNTQGDLSLTGKSEDSLGQRDDGKMVFGKDARPWQPVSPPTFGQIGGRFGLAQVQENSQRSSGGSPASTDQKSPSIFIDGEIWITPEFTFHARIKQEIITQKGPTDENINQSFSMYEAAFGYMFRFGPHVWSPNIEPFGGYFTARLYSDDASQAFATSEYSGLKIGVRGSTPIDARNEWGVGGEFNFALQPTLRESPFLSGSSNKANYVQMGVMGYKRIGERLKVVAGLDYELYSASFSGTGRPASATSSSTSQKFLTLSGGVYYMF